MAIKGIEADWWGARTLETSRVPPGTKIIKRGGACPVEIIFHTPNIAERRDWIRVDGEYCDIISYFYLKEDIRFYEQTFGGWVRGGIRFWRWESIPEEDCGYEQVEKRLLQHPLVGRKAILLFGDEKPGIHDDLLESREGFRIEERSVRGKEPRIVTTKAVLTRALILSGERGNILGPTYGKPLFKQPQLIVQLLEGEHQGEEVRVSANSLSLLVDFDREDISLVRKVRDRVNLSREKRERLHERGFTDDLLFWIAGKGHAFVPESTNLIKPRREISKAQVDKIREYASMAGIDISGAISIATTIGGHVTSVHQVIEDYENDEVEEATDISVIT